MSSWQISRRKLSFEKTLVMGVLNVTPDSFSDGGRFLSVDDAVRQAERLVVEGADIIDVGGESTRPGSRPIDAETELRRVLPVVEHLSKRFELPISIDTTKSAVAERAVDAGAVIINDVSGLRFDERTADIAAQNATGLILMHSCGGAGAMHSQPPVQNIFNEVSADFRRAIGIANARGVTREQIVLDPGIGFGKSPEQNLELIAKLDKLKSDFSDFPFLVGVSRKSFIGKLTGNDLPEERLAGSLGAIAIAVWNGADIIRVHDVKETVDALKVVEAIKQQL
jgi:dihydropteroate synthase